MPNFFVPVQFYWITPFCLKHFVRGCRLRLRLSHLRDQKFKHVFHDSLNQNNSYGLDIETACNYLFHSPNFTKERSVLLNTFSKKKKIF